MTKKLPPDPEHMNAKRAKWGRAAILNFQLGTGTDYEDTLGDLLCDLMHWCDRSNFDFEASLDRARWHYREQTTNQQQ